MESLDEQLEPLIKIFNEKHVKSVNGIEKYTAKVVEAIKQYYANPNLDTFENTLAVSFACDKETAAESHYIVRWDVFLTEILGKVSDGLTVAMLSHGRKNEDRFAK